MSNPRKQPRRDCTTDTEEDNMTTTIQVSLLQSINNKRSTLEMMHADIKELKTSLEFTQSLIDTLQAENKDLKLSVSKLTTDMETGNNENKLMRDVQSLSNKAGICNPFTYTPRPD